MSPWLNKNTNLFPESSGWPPVLGWWQVLITNGRNNTGAVTAPSWGLGPTLKPIFSLLFMENVPTSHTNKLFGWLFKGSINNLFCRGWYLFSFPPQPPDTAKIPTLDLGQLQVNSSRRWKDWTQRIMPALLPDGSHHCILGKAQAWVQASHTIIWDHRPSEAQSFRKARAHHSTHKALHAYP